MVSGWLLCDYVFVVKKTIQIKHEIAAQKATIFIEWPRLNVCLVQL